jgi:FtsP/CotA-like multicopper oxidase with cupredoxin domain
VRERPVRRRRWLRRVVLVLAAVAAFPAAMASFAVYSYLSADLDTTGEVSFAQPLRVPELASSRVDEAGRRVFDLQLQRGTTDFGTGQQTRTWGIDGSYLGPTLRAQRGEQVLVNVTNDVGETSTLHWHGMHLPAEMDGGPHQMVAPRTTWSPTWRIDQPAATLWYHPHLHGTTAEHVYRGLAGMFLLDDDHSRSLPLPQDYGVDDLPVIVQDKSFDDDGQLDRSSRPFSGVGQLGDTILVNGTPTPHHEVRTQRVRLRLLNASNARTYGFGLAGDASFALVATDGGLLPEPVDARRVPLSPGERAEIVVTLQPGQDVVLRSYPVDLGGGRFSQRFNGGDDTFDVLQLRAADRLSPSPELPTRLAAASDLDEAEAARTRTFQLQGRSINGRRMELSRIDEAVTLGETEVWEMRNAGGTPHNFHVHDVQFRVLTVDGDPPPPQLGGHKDTVYLAPGSTVRLVLRFSDYADPNMPYMFHCHLLQHEDAGMMGQFVVVRPGQRAGAPPPSDHGDHALLPRAQSEGLPPQDDTHGADRHGGTHDS